LVKYLVRHVSREIPPGLERGLPDNEPHHRILRQELEGFDLTKVPEGMRRLIIALRINVTVECNEQLFTSAFANNLVGRTTFTFRIAQDHAYESEICYKLLRGVGYDVTL
jgi:hypothetical protein